MDWKKALLAGLAGGVAMSFAEFILHGMVMAETYAKYADVFSQEQANPLYFLLIAVCISLAAAILFGKTRQMWADGAKGGLVFGLHLGAVVFFARFYDALVYEGYPYYLSWCQGGINLIVVALAGVVMGLVYRRA